MLYHPSAVLLALLLFPAIHPRETVAKKGAPGAHEMEVRFQDGSVLRMVALQENLEVTTRYGKLTVPVAEVRLATGAQAAGREKPPKR